MKSYDIDRGYPTLYQLHQLQWERTRRQMFKTMLVYFVLFGGFAYMMFN